MKYALLSAVLFPVVANAAYVTNFDSFVPQNTLPSSVANFTDSSTSTQDGWVIDDTSTGDLSYLHTVAGLGSVVGLGGLYSSPLATSVNLTRAVSVPAGGASFNIDFALTNSGPPTYFTNDDIFGFTLSDSSGPLLTIDLRPTIVESVRKVFIGELGAAGVGLTPNGITPSDHGAPIFYGLALSFTANGANLDYTGSIASGGVFFSGSLAGKASTTISKIGVDFDVTAAAAADAGSNSLLIDNLSLVPEPSVTLTGLLALGALAGRRRRR
jgi:MYXO-CTERM domain-containing protein